MTEIRSFTCATPGTVLIQCCASSMDSSGPSGLMRTATLTLVLLSIAALIMIFELIYSFDIIFNPPPGKVIRGDLYRTKSKDQDAHSLC